MDKALLENELKKKLTLIDQELIQFIPSESMTPSVIHKAMRYSLFAGGKRLRPVLVLAACEAVSGHNSVAVKTACALEMIHTYSLIHDDLPAMDDDDLRRGKPTNHKVFGEDMAILAGDALLTRAFEILAEPNADIPLKIALQVIKEIAEAAGTMGMIGGQVVDMMSENKQIDENVLKYIHSHKTGALMRASIRVGALIGNATNEQMEALTKYADQLGLAFQITDDILDVEGDSAILGKTAGSDERKQKSTYPSIYGLKESKQLAETAVNESIAALDSFDEKADFLRDIAKYLIYRNK